jgi:hypothetical protein
MQISLIKYLVLEQSDMLNTYTRTTVSFVSQSKITFPISLHHYTVCWDVFQCANIVHSYVFTFSAWISFSVAYKYLI